MEIQPVMVMMTDYIKSLLTVTGQIAYLEEKVLTDDNEKHKLFEQNQKLETQCSQMDAIHQVWA